MKRAIGCLFRWGLCALLLVMLLGNALGEGAPSLPALTAKPQGTEFSCEELIVRLPVGMEPMDEEELAGYDAAAQLDFPDTAQTLLTAVNADRSAALCFAICTSDQSPLAAAQEAATVILGSADNAAELAFGENKCAGFAVAVEDAAFRIYFFSDGERLLLVTLSGLSDEEARDMLATVEF